MEYNPFDSDDEDYVGIITHKLDAINNCYKITNDENDDDDDNVGLTSTNPFLSQGETCMGRGIPAFKSDEPTQFNRSKF